jgi:hypothetical protein
MLTEKSAIEVGNDCVILYMFYLNTTRKFLLEIMLELEDTVLFSRIVLVKTY